MAEDTKRDPFPKDAKGQLIAPDYVGKEGRRIIDALQKARPRILEQPGGMNPSRVVVAPASPLLEQSRGSVTRRQRADEFPTRSTIEETVAATSVPNITFILSNASTSLAGVTTYKVKVFDGKIESQFPAGMGFDNYVLTLGTPSDSIIYAGITFNPTTLAITSRFLGVSTSGGFPPSQITSTTAGEAYWQLGFTYLLDTTLKIVNNRVGDIYFKPVYGAFNGVPALRVDDQVGWLSLPT